MKKVLIVSYAYKPFQTIGVTRIVSYVKYLKRLGWDVAVMSAKDNKWTYDGLRSEEDEELGEHIIRLKGISLASSIRALTGHRLKGSGQSTSEITRGRNPFKKCALYFYKNWLSYPDECASWLWFNRGNAVREARKFDPDIILSTALPVSSHLVASHIQKKLLVPWIAEYRDLWTGHFMFERSTTAEDRQRRLELKTIENAAHLVTVSEPLAGALRDLHGKETSIIYNGFDPDDFYQTGKKNNHKMTMIYTGMVYDEVQKPGILFEALSDLKRQGAISSADLEFKYYGPNQALFQSLANKHEVNDLCTINGSVPRSVVLREQQEADLLVFFSFSKEGWLSGKIFEYLGAARNILAIGPEDKYIRELIDPTACGVYVHDATRLGETLLQFLGEFRASAFLKYSGNDLRFQYTRETMALRLSTLMETILRP